MNSPGLDRNLLRDVSRSFYLSLCILPSRMRSGCALGYLLARLSDTIADTPTLPVCTRLQLLRDFQKTLDGTLPLLQLQSNLSISLRPHIRHPGESRLIDATAACFRELTTLEPGLAHAVAEVIRTITAGQESDLRSFGYTSSGTLHCLRSADQLITYTDQVAGSVGRFWTRAGLLCHSNFSRLPLPALNEKGTGFGQALQLINILRDLPEDLDSGRCYLPREELDQEGWNSSLPWRGQSAILLKVSAAWESRATAGLQDGLDYANSLLHTRIRFATALPALLGFQTLDLLRCEPQKRLAGKIKISRSHLHRTLRKALVAAVTGRPFAKPAPAACSSE